MEQFEDFEVWLPRILKQAPFMRFLDVESQRDTYEVNKKIFEKDGKISVQDQRIQELERKIEEFRAAMNQAVKLLSEKYEFEAAVELKKLLDGSSFADPSAKARGEAENNQLPLVEPSSLSFEETWIQYEQETKKYGSLPSDLMTAVQLVARRFWNVAIECEAKHLNQICELKHGVRMLREGLYHSCQCSGIFVCQSCKILASTSNLIEESVKEGA